MPETTALETILKAIPNIGGYAAAVIVLVALYTKKLRFDREVQDVVRQFEEYKAESEKRFAEYKAEMMAALKDSRAECREYTELAKQALISSRRMADAAQTATAALKEGK